MALDSFPAESSYKAQLMKLSGTEAEFRTLLIRILHHKSPSILLIISCLLSVPLNDKSLYNANKHFIISTLFNTRSIPFDSVVNGKLIKHLPAIEFANSDLAP